jgi:MFS family permease
MNRPPSARPTWAQLLALNRTVGVVLLSVLFFGLGEQLWSQFMPLYLGDRAKDLARTVTDATAGARPSTGLAPSAAGQETPQVPWNALLLVGLYACLRNLFEGFCYIGGGQLTAFLGDRGSLLLFGALTVLGYVLFLSSTSPVLGVVAALLILGWEPLSVPVTFTTVGATVADAGRGMAFALQSIQKRLPKILGPLLAGFVLGAAEGAAASPEAGRLAGMRWLVGVALALAAASVAVQLVWMPHHKPPPPGPPALTILRGLHPTLRRLLLAEVFTRWCDWLVREFVVLYVVLIRGASMKEAGLLFALQNLVALLTYLPIGSLTRTAGLQPFVGLTFVFFALLPLALATVPDGWLPLAFVVYGLREIGEPARKALITSLLPPEVRARGVGLYWGLRSFAVCSASLAGAWLWYTAGPEQLLYVAFALGCVGAGLYYALCRRT